MSSISFPTEQQGSSTNNGHFYPPPFDTNSSFQMNPLSPHPPRTPRTSIISSTSTIHAYDSSIYETKEGTGEAVSDGGEDDDNEEAVQVLEDKISRAEVWRELFITSNGRDKALVWFYCEFIYMNPLILLVMAETNAIFYSIIPPLPYFTSCQSGAETTYPSTLGVGINKTATVHCFWTILLKVVYCFSLCLLF